MCDVSGNNQQNDDEIHQSDLIYHFKQGHNHMSNSDGQSCTTSKPSLWVLIIAILHLLVLTCIAASLWNIDDAILAANGMG